MVMGIEWLQKLLSSEQFKIFVQTYIATKSLDTLLKKLIVKPPELSIEYQLLDCMANALYDSRKRLGWENNLDTSDNYETITQTFIGSLIDPNAIYTRKHLTLIFQNAVGHPVYNNEIECWILCFLIQLSSKEHEHVRELLILQNLLDAKKCRISHIEEQFIDRFHRVLFSDGEAFLTLSEIYMPNRYCFRKGVDIYDDLFELILQFTGNMFDDWLARKKVAINEDISALVIFAHPGTGKSTLISKIISEYHVGNSFCEKQLYVISFSDRMLRTKHFNIENICAYLSITIDNLKDSLLIIDGLDESDLSYSEAFNKLEDIIYDLKSLNSKLIVTSRHNYLPTNDLRFSLSISLLQFSCEQAFEWIDKYHTIYKTTNVDLKRKQIENLPSEMQVIILIPHILHTCIKYDIDMNKVTELAKLYDLLFDGIDAEFALTNYNKKPRTRAKEWVTLQNKITKIAIHTYKSNDNTITFKEICGYSDNESIQTNKLTTEFLLYLKDNDKYSFAHNSIPCYFIAKQLYEVTVLSCEEGDYKNLILSLDLILGYDFMLSTNITSFIEYFVRTSQYKKIDAIINILKNFLSDKLITSLVMPMEANNIKTFYLNRFISILRLTLAFITPNIDNYAEFDLLELLDENEIVKFINYSDLGNCTLDCLKICTLNQKTLDGINLSGTNLYGKRMKNVKMRNSKFYNANLSGAYLMNSDFTLSSFEEVRCHNADFSNSILFEASFRSARLNGSNFTNANLCYVDFRGAILKKTKFNGANLYRAKIMLSQLWDLWDYFDLCFIKENNIDVYANEMLLSTPELETEYKNMFKVRSLLRSF